ncbi:MAG: hypothetical protein QM770_00585 [Tepidisphaeraceae bacterium]
MPRQPIMLIIVGLLLAAFYVATDPTLGLGASLGDGANTNRVDAAHYAWPGTIIGLTGTAVTTVIAAWLTSRRVG